MNEYVKVQLITREGGGGVYSEMQSVPKCIDERVHDETSREEIMQNVLIRANGCSKNSSPRGKVSINCICRQTCHITPF